MGVKFLSRGEGRLIVLFRGMIALLFMALILAFSFNSLVVDPAHEADELPVMTSFSSNDPTLWMSQDVYIVVVRISLSSTSSVDHPSLGSRHMEILHGRNEEYFHHCRRRRHGVW